MMSIIDTYPRLTIRRNPKRETVQLTPTIADGKIQSVAITKAGRGYEDPKLCGWYNNKK